MLTLYRGHWILTFCNLRWSSEITEWITGEILPTSVSAETDEGPEVCLTRAKRLVDVYLRTSEPRQYRYAGR